MALNFLHSRYFSICDLDDKELLVIENPQDLDENSRAAPYSALESQSFRFEITKILRLEEELEFFNWEVITTQGQRVFQTKKSRFPTKIADCSLLIQDLAGDLYTIPSVESLDEEICLFLGDLDTTSARLELDRR